MMDDHHVRSGGTRVSLVAIYVGLGKMRFYANLRTGMSLRGSNKNKYLKSILVIIGRREISLDMDKTSGFGSCARK